MFGGRWIETLDAELAKVFGGGFHRFGVDFVDGEEDGFAGADEEAGELDVGRGEFGAAVDNHDDRGGFVKGEAGLGEDFGGDEVVVIGHDAAGVDDASDLAAPFDFAVDAVAGDAGFVANDGAATPGDAIEEGRFTDVGASADGEEGCSRQLSDGIRRISWIGKKSTWLINSGCRLLRAESRRSSIIGRALLHA